MPTPPSERQPQPPSSDNWATDQRAIAAAELIGDTRSELRLGANVIKFSLEVKRKTDHELTPPFLNIDSTSLKYVSPPVIDTVETGIISRINTAGNSSMVDEAAIPQIKEDLGFFFSLLKSKAPEDQTPEESGPKSIQEELFESFNLNPELVGEMHMQAALSNGGTLSVSYSPSHGLYGRALRFHFQANGGTLNFFSTESQKTVALEGEAAHAEIKKKLAIFLLSPDQSTI